MGVRFVTRAAMAAFILAAVAVAPARAAGFLSSVDDLPLMPGLAEKPAAALLFDTPAGRVAESVAEGDVGADAVIAFYAATLPELGWVSVTPKQYRRDNETLRLDMVAGRRLTVQFTVTPADTP